MKKNKGITLIALVITIIILIILAGVVINLTLGESGILNRAKNAQKLSLKETIKEKIETVVLESQIEEVTNGGTLTHEKLYDILTQKDESISLEDYNEGDTVLKGRYTLEDEREFEFTIDENLKVIVGEEVKPKPIKFGKITWNENKAQVELTSKISEAIEYQVDGTTDGNWTQGKLVSNLSHGNIVYARINDGTTITEIQKLEIRDKIRPEEFTITVAEADISYDGMKITGTAEDKQTGILNYTYVVVKSGTIVKEIKEQAAGYTITGLAEQTEYTVYMIAYDNAGNIRKSNEVTVKTTKTPLGKLYGQYVNYGIDLNGNGVTTDDWRIFYKNEDESSDYYGDVFIIAASYAPPTKISKALSNVGLKYSNYYVYWDYNVNGTVSGSATVSNEVRQRFMYNYTASNNNSKVVAQLLTPSKWEANLVTTQLKEKGGMAVGAPTIQMWCASWNEVYPTQKITAAINGTGYTVNGQALELGISGYNGYKNAPNVYIPTKSAVGNANSYWIASPCYGHGLKNYLWRIACSTAKIEYGTIGTQINVGIRPVVCLPASVKLKQTDTPNLWDVVYD